MTATEPMLTVAPEYGTVENTRDRMLTYLREKRCPKVEALDAYYDGRHPLPAPPETMRRFEEAGRAWASLSRLAVTNYMPPIADAPAARLRPIGFRTGDTDVDAQAWDVWQRNHLDADVAMAFHKALTVGNSFLFVWPDRDGNAVITIEDPGQAMVAYVPGSRRQRAAGLKTWCEDDGSHRVVLYMPDKVYKWTKPSEQAPLVEWHPSTDDTWPIANPRGVVPLIELRANPDVRPALYGGGRGEFEIVLIDQDRINKTVFDRLVTGEFQAFRQRYAIGWVPKDMNQAMQMSVRRLLSFEGDPSEVQVGEFAQADFSPFLSAVEKDVRKIATTTSTPFYLFGELANPPSGDALMEANAGLVLKTEGHRDNFGETVEEAIALALAIEGVAGVQGAEVVWASVAHHTWAEKADAAVKMRAVGVPDEALWEFLEFTPQQIDRFRVQRASAELFAPPPPVATAGGFGQ